METQPVAAKRWQLVLYSGGQKVRSWLLDEKPSYIDGRFTWDDVENSVTGSCTLERIDLNSRPAGRSF